MRIKLRSLLALAMCVVLLAPLLSGCSTSGSASEIKVIRIGTHAQSEDDPTWVDSITGESSMDPDAQAAATTALAKVEEELGVEIQFLQYSSDVTQILLQTVLAGDPYCELAILWGGVQGTILSQNVLQPIDDYADIFLDDPDGQWILPTKTFGRYYLMNRDLLFCNTWPIVYNIDMIEEAGLEYPTDLYYSGQWTWSNFKEYMSRLKTYYAGKKASTGEDIVPFNTNYTYFALMGLTSVGAGVYDGEAMKVDTDDAIEVCEFMDELFTEELATCSTASSTSNNSGWLTASTAFQNGETVFTNCARWRMGTASTILAERGESMGIVPFPYPDEGMVMRDEDGNVTKDENYHLLSPMADSVGLMKGIDAETSRLALEAYKMYKVEYYKALAHVDSIAEYMEEQAASNALTFGIDIFHDEVGDDNLEVWKEYGSEPANDFSEACGVMWTWGGIFGNSVYGVNATPKYRTAIKANKATIEETLNTINEAVNKSGAVDSVKPTIKQTDKTLAFPAGTDPREVDWSEYLTASDDIDGDYNIGRLTLDLTASNFSKVGTYEDGLVATVTDAGGNVGESKFDILIYDPDNTDPPTIVLDEEGTHTVSLNADTSTISWGNYVESATDADGLDITSNISADVGWLDVTEKGTYVVDIVATDFVGNSVSASINVTVQ
ncbi:MAG: hypothetical protein LUG52_02855 [Clostridia bacterium]|nr:hypothetical protein [Clostridia bacterium]